MFLLTVVFGPTPTPWAFLFKDQKLANEALDKLITAKTGTVDNILISDEFGQTGMFEVHVIHGFMLEDMDKSKLAAVERAIHQEHVKIEANVRADSDQKIKSFRSGQQRGPAIISSMGNGGFPQ